MIHRYAQKPLALLSLALLIGGASDCLAQTRKRSKVLWAVSVAALVAANVLDAHSSLGRPEANSLIQSSQGRFSATRGVLIKSSATGGSLMLQALLFRTRGGEKYYKPATWVNFACAGTVGAVALRNGRLSPETTLHK